MTKILIDEATVRLALEGIESMTSWEHPDDPAHPWTDCAKLLRDALAEQPAPVQQEPCGWQFFQDGKWHNGMETNNHRANTEAAGVPVRDVYPSPQPAQCTWVGLTDDEIWETVSRIGTSDSDVNPYAKLADARAIEAKLRRRTHDTR